MSHTFGAHWSNGEIAIVPIPKCASSALEAAVARAGSFGLTGLPCTEEAVLAIVRDPYDRFWSGIRQYERDKGLELPRDEVRVYDEHTLHQSWFLLPFRNVELIPLERSTERLAGYGITMGRANTAPAEPNPYDRDQVEAFYSADVQLHQRALQS